MSTSIYNPQACGSVCAGPFSASDTGHVAGDQLIASAVNDEFNFADASITLDTGEMGTVLETNTGTATASAEHDDTWFCSSAAQCAALSMPGALIPVDLNFHVAISGTLTPEGGYMDLTYTYYIYSLLGSTANALFQFEFNEDPGLGPEASVSADGEFQDTTTGRQKQIQGIFATESANSGQFALSANLTVQTFIVGCPTAGCDLSGGVFADTQQLRAEVDGPNDGSAQLLDSSHTFGVSLDANTPFESQDGRQVSPLVPEPASCITAAIGIVFLLLRRRLR